MRGVFASARQTQHDGGQAVKRGALAFGRGAVGQQGVIRRGAGVNPVAGGVLCIKPQQGLDEGGFCGRKFVGAQSKNRCGRRGAGCHDTEGALGQMVFGAGLYPSKRP